MLCMIVIEDYSQTAQRHAIPVAHNKYKITKNTRWRLYRWEDIRQHGEVFFVCSPRRKLQCVKICERDSHVFLIIDS